MHRRLATLGGIAAVAALLTGCQPQQPFYFRERGDIAHYKDVATEIEYPDVEVETLDEVLNSHPTPKPRDIDKLEYWDLSLEEAVQTALANARVIRTLGGVFSPGFRASSANLLPTGQLLNNPQAAQTIYGPAIAETDPRFGTEAALSAFDAQLSASMFWEKNDRPVNITFGNFLSPVLEQDLGTWRAEIAKTTATGGRFALRNNTGYEWNNNRANTFPSVFNTDIEAEFRHPLLAGAGLEFNRIAGPNSVPGVYNGVLLARINTDVQLAEFEGVVLQMVADVERAYWELNYAYRSLAAAKSGLESAREAYRTVNEKFQTGVKGGEAAAHAQAMGQFHSFNAQVHNAWHDLLIAEARVRHIMGIAITDGRIARPSQEPSTAKVEFDESEIKLEALTRNVNLRRQKWILKRRESELVAARNYLLPRLDLVGRYRWRGFGDDLSSSNRSADPFRTATQSLSSGDFQEWQAGVQLNVPIGFRAQHAAVRNAELTLMQERARYQEQELALDHTLKLAMLDLESQYDQAKINYNRYLAAKYELDNVMASYEIETITFDQVADAQRRLADAEAAYFRALTDYNISLVQIHFTKGSLLELNGVFLAEGAWPGKAHFDARRRARERSAGLKINYGFTRPGVFSRGAFPQRMTVTDEAADQIEGEPHEAPSEVLPGEARERLDDADVSAPSEPSIEEPAHDASGDQGRHDDEASEGRQSTSLFPPPGANGGRREAQFPAVRRVSHQSEPAGNPLFEAPGRRSQPISE